MYSSNEELLEGIKESGVEYVGYPLLARPAWRDAAFSIPASAFTEDVFEEGLAFDGSFGAARLPVDRRVRHDAAARPGHRADRSVPQAKTMNLGFFVHDPFTREAYSRDPRNVARKAEDYLASTGIADTCFFGAEAEFYIFDSVSLTCR